MTSVEGFPCGERRTWHNVCQSCALTTACRERAFIGDWPVVGQSKVLANHWPVTCGFIVCRSVVCLSGFGGSSFDVRRSTFDVRRSTFDVRRSLVRWFVVVVLLVVVVLAELLCVVCVGVSFKHKVNEQTNE